MRGKKKKAPAQPRFHIKKGDDVVVISGANRQGRGKVLQVLRDKNRVLVEGVNLIKKTMRKTQESPEGGIVEREGSIHVSNVMKLEEFDKRAAKRSGAAAAETTSAAKKPAAKTTATTAEK